MKMMAPLCLFLSCVLLLAAPVGAVRQKAGRAGQAVASDGNQAQSDAVAVISSLLKRLQTEQQATASFSEQVEGWCRDTKAQRGGMAETVERKLDESRTLMKQIDAESKRLRSEAKLVDANTEEKKEQAASAKDAEELAEQEFQEEQHDVSRTIEAVHHAIRLVSRSASSSLRGAPAAPEMSAVTNLVQVASNDAMTDAERQIMSSYVSDTAADSKEGGKSTEEARRSLLSTLSSMLERLQQEQGNARSDEDKEKAKLGGFNEHLEEAIAATKSERQALKFELAQRNRDHARFESQVSDLGQLLQTVKNGQKATADACWEHENVRQRIDGQLSAGIDTVKSVLEQAAPESADMFLAPAAPVSLSFLQVSSSAVSGDLRTMASKYPEQAALYMRAAREMETLARPRSGTNKGSPTAVAPSSGASSDTGAAIQDIEAFAKDENSGGSSDAADALVGESAVKAKATYRKLLGQLQQEQKTLREEGSWCASILGEAASGHAAIARSLKQSQARLNLMKVAMLQYEKSSQYYTEQANAATRQAEELVRLTETEHNLYAQTTKAVSEFSKQLMGLGMELGSSVLAEDRRNADLVRGLVQKLEEHQNLCEAAHDDWGKGARNVANSDAALQDILKTDVGHNDRRILQFRTEAQFLQSMADSRVNDKALADGYQSTAKKICPEGLPAQIQQQQAALEQQVKELQASYNSRFNPDDEEGSA